MQAERSCSLGPSAGSHPTPAQVDIPDDFSIIPGNAYLDGFVNGSACSSAHTGRSVKMYDERYEVRVPAGSALRTPRARV